MAKRTFNAFNLTLATNALGSAAAASSYMAIQPAGSATQIVDLDEVFISGMASASTIGAFLIAQISTFATTPTALAAPNSDGPMVQNATPTIQTTYIVASTNPTPSSSITAPKLNVGLNAFGGIVRWNAAPTQQWTMVGNAAPGGGILINSSAVTGAASALVDAHFIYEPY